MESKSGKDDAGRKDPVSWAFPQEGFEGLLQANAKAAEIWLESWAKLAGESAGFLSRRWRQDRDLLEQILACKTPVELLQLQSTFLQRALVDYMQEAGKLADMETAAGVSEIEAIDRGVKEASK
jgi:hypothetical protein